MARKPLEYTLQRSYPTGYSTDDSTVWVDILYNPKSTSALFCVELHKANGMHFRTPCWTLSDAVEVSEANCRMMTQKLAEV